MQFETCEMFISGIIHLKTLDHGWPQVTETEESKTAYKGTIILGCFGLIHHCESGTDWFISLIKHSN